MKTVRRGKHYRNDLRWHDGSVLHACEGDRAVDSDAGTFLVWTLCGRDVPADRSWASTVTPICTKCIAVQQKEPQP